jgi:DNA-binding Xre family transcriptional regulator
VGFTLRVLAKEISTHYNPAMAKRLISEQLREAVARCGKTRYRIHKETGIAESQLSRFVNDPSVGISLTNIDKLCECIGAQLVLGSESVKPAKRKTAKRNGR